MTSHDKYLEKNMENILLKVEKNIQFIAGQLIDTRNKINQRFEKIFQDHHGQFRAVCDDLQEICNRIYKYENNLKIYENKYNESSEAINKYISDAYARADIHIIQERILHTIECNFLQEEINKMNSVLTANGLKFNENLNDFIIETRDSTKQLNDKLKEQNNLMVEMADKNMSMFDEAQRARDVIEINQIVNEMVTKVDNSMMVDNIQKSKDTEFKIMEQLQEHNVNIKNSIDKINDNKQHIDDLKNNLNSLEKKVSGNDQYILDVEQKMMRIKAEADEMERKESVAKVMETMLINVENAITKEKMDKMGEFDFNSMRKAIITMEEQLSTLSSTPSEIDIMQKDIKKLYEETDTLKNKPKSGDDIKLATVQMLNNVEFENIYSILNSGNLANGQPGGENVNYSEMMENKINGALEKIKNDNEKMWINIVNMKDKVTDPEEIKKILNQVHPAIVPSSDASKIIDEVEPYEDQTYMPKVNGFDMVKQKNNENNFYGNNYNNNQQDPGPDINSKKSSKKTGSKKSNNSKTKANGIVNVTDNNVNNDNNNINQSSNPNNPNNEEKNSKVSKKSKTSKVSKKSKKEEEKNVEEKNSKNNNQPNNKEEENIENKSNKSKKINSPPVGQSQEQSNKQENEEKEDNKENEEDDEEDDENNEEEENNNMGTKEDLQGKLKKNEEISGKSLTGIKK